MATKLDKVDAVIVGSGWAGGIVAAELSKKGYKVVGLERGADKKSEDYIGTKDELRFSMRYEMMQDLTKETITSRNGADQTALPVRTNENAFLGTDTGGAGVHWNGHNFRYLPYDFEIYSKTVERYGKNKIPKGMTLQDWGVTYDDMEKYYDKYEKMAGISGEENPIGPYRSDKFPNPPMKDTPSIKLFKQAAKELGYHPYQIPSANVTQQYENPDGETINACVYCAFCETYGCDFGAKADPIITVLATAKKTGNYELRNDAYATKVIHDGEKATGVLYMDIRTGEEFEQPADIVVLAGFVFTNTKLLLTSKIGKPYDPKTGTGVIGKNFTGHFSNVTYLGARGYFKDKKFNSFAGAGALASTLDDFSGDNIDHSDLDFLHGFEPHIRVMGDRPIGNNHVPKGTPSWGREFKEKSLYYTNRNLYVDAQAAALPWAHNYLDLDPTYKDFAGNPLLRVTYKYSKQDIKLGQYAIKRAAEIMEKMGADIVDEDELPDDTQFNNSYPNSHNGGGAIMGTDPKTSAVNTYSQMWDMDNLFVVGSSSFPHFSNYNPTETIGAFAYRASEGMDQYLKNGSGLIEKPSV
ncbi:Gluconate 2-dehydrogenase (acceptor) [Lentibacillus sp. JNUCC-1]|uniref:GMC family oxidoreductase n=1 Tax=Lentibacillus sp. JNUCC-1 TaxID=2654513 RepID=UPI0012E7B99A|nr:GMC family oxidoreductase [Lentibacillus sp. JNUCC-1]MUV38224.1 Gluconate 2-dehydrogenase (acceptor) [Lentibacillus sp. JNUCC-1]